MARGEHFHIFLKDLKSPIPFSPPPGGMPPNIPNRDRKVHSEYLIRRFQTIWKEIEKHKLERIAASIPTKDGFYIQFKGKTGCELVTKSLENIKKDIRLLNVKVVKQKELDETYATVYIPNRCTEYFLDKIREYANPEKDNINKNTGKANPKNMALVASIEDLTIASQLDAFWRDSLELLPLDIPIWCEIWLLYSEKSNKSDVINKFFTICNSLNIEFKREFLHFPERLVLLVKANGVNLKELIERSDSIAEFRKAQEAASFWTSQTNIEQLDWVKDLLSRIKISETVVVISILDGGVNNGHLLLQPILNDNDCHTYIPEWGIHDNDEHGTLMSGIASYENLQEKLESLLPIELKHKLESIKILPPKQYGENPYELWGEIVAQSISRAEIAHPEYNRIFCMAVTSERGTDNGSPSSWSAAIDALTSGAEDNIQRLFIISAGNIITQEDWKLYPESNKKSPIQSPAQSWNALTIGAYTNKIQINETAYKGYKTLAKADSLSPYSTTSLPWESNKWPLKPDIVLEGGNLIVATDGFISNLEDLSSLTVSANSTKEQFDIINGTSEATAHASWFAAQLQVRYPNAWPETLRGLMVHSAEWTKELISQFNIDTSKKGSIAELIRICGYGVPDLRKAMSSLDNSLTLIAQEEIQPFCKREGGGYRSNEMHLYQLPWPKEDLLALGAMKIKVKITLSYFIEPGPGEIGWKDRYRYASHGLRFELNNPTETLEDFTRRINVAIEREEDYQSIKNDTDRWNIGSGLRHHGSLHSDFIEKTAAEIASCNLIGIYPVVGWWRERTNLKQMEKKSRYSLIISLHTDNQEIDLYTPIINMINIPITIKT
ncbi:MAG TPA: S8 family peptidase [Williamwhitmania sp.]|nr:S8 family peptidase [Williamwhitmania sp.]